MRMCTGVNEFVPALHRKQPVQHHIAKPKTFRINQQAASSMKLDTSVVSEMFCCEAIKLGIGKTGASDKRSKSRIEILLTPRYRPAVAICVILVVFSIAIHNINQVIAVGQDFEDLSKETFGNVVHTKPSSTMNQQQAAFQSRQSQSHQQVSQQVSTSTSMSRQSMQRPNRFLPNNSNQQLAVQESSPQAFAAPPTSRQQQSPGQATSNIEQMMKNAISRTAQSPELSARSDETQSVSHNSPTNARSTSSASSTSLTPAATSAPPTAASNSAKTPEPAEPQSAEADSGDDEKQTTAAQTSTTSGHETVYSDQRFANLFARRNANKKSRIQPHEQVKAKPTLPSFIKSPPDPKQFATQPQIGGQDRGSNQQAGNSFVSQRIQQQQQQNQARAAALNQQKKPVITSNSAATASNKRNNSLNAKQVSSPSGSKSTTPSPKAASTTSKPINQPFNRVNNDPASVIAMARKRLLANNALESSKLKLQQQNKPSN